MLPLLPVAAAGIAVILGARSRKERKKLAAQQPDAVQKKTSLQQMKTTMVRHIARADERYQNFVQHHIDPLLGKTRNAQLQNLLSAETFALSPEERTANHRLGLGVVTLGLALTGQWLFSPLIWVAALTGFIAGLNTYQLAYQQWQQTRRLTALHLICLYMICLWLGGYAAFGALGTLLLGIGLKAKAITENQSRNQLVRLTQVQPGRVWIRTQDNELEIPFDQLALGDVLVLQAGQTVPVDGTIVAGGGCFDQHQLTGESQPVEKGEGEAVLAATLLISGQIELRVEKTGAETTAGQIEQILNSTAQYQPQTSLKVEQLTDRLTLPTLALSIVSWPWLGTVGAVTLLGANSTFATQMSGPLGVLNFLNLAADRGILVKDGRALEQFSGIDTVLFDKTGTLTLDQPQVAAVHPVQGWSADRVLALAAAAEARQTHPIAQAILAAADAQELDLPAVAPVHYALGLGLKVRLVSDRPAAQDQYDPLIRVGSDRFMSAEGIVLPEEIVTLTQNCQQNGHSLVMIAVDDRLAGCIELQPTVRPEVPEVIQALRAEGLRLYIVSGDQEAPTRHLAQQLDMDYIANTLPGQKADRVSALQQAGHRVCFIGDGINDAVAMRQADVSVSLRGATTAATDTAQIILMEGNLHALCSLLQLATGFERNLAYNFRFTTGVSLAATAGILWAGFTFAATEVFFSVSLIGGLAIAMQPLLNNRKYDSLPGVDNT